MYRVYNAITLVFFKSAHHNKLYPDDDDITELFPKQIDRRAPGYINNKKLIIENSTPFSSHYPRIDLRIRKQQHSLR